MPMVYTFAIFKQRGTCQRNLVATADCHAAALATHAVFFQETYENTAIFLVGILV